MRDNRADDRKRDKTRMRILEAEDFQSSHVCEIKKKFSHWQLLAQSMVELLVDQC
jgi:hypothetical protein